jgi:UPF0755 protein
VNDDRRGGRHSDDGTGAVPPFYWVSTASGAGSYDAAPRYEDSRYEVSSYDGTHVDTAGLEAVRDVPSWATPDWSIPRYAEPATGSQRRVSGLLDRHPATDPVADRDRWGHRPEADAHDSPWTAGSRHPSAPVPPLPGGAWDRLQMRAGHPDDDGATEAHPLTPDVPQPTPRSRSYEESDDSGYAQRPDEWDDPTGGLEVIGAHVDDGAGRRRRRGRDDEHEFYADEVHDDLHEVDLHDEVLDAPHDDEGSAGGLHDDDIPLQPYDRRSARARRRRRPLQLLISLIVLGGLVAGIVIGGQKLLGVLNPSSQDYTGQGTSSIEIRVQDGDTLSDIARTLVDAGVIASVGPFVDAAEAHPDAMGIQPGVYQMRLQMSGQAALDLLLAPDSRLVSRVTLREGLTVPATLAELAEATGTPLPELEAAAADTAALGVPAWARGNVEGLLFPATYDFEPDTAPVDMLRAMVTRATQALDQLNIPAEQRLQMLTEASLVQAEAASPEDMARVATVLNNRIAAGMPLQLDSTVNYATGKGGVTTTAEDRANPSPYNTYAHPGLPPGPIGNPGEDAMRAVLTPAPGDWLFFVTVNPDTGETRFARTAEEHEQNVLLFQQWLRENPGG